MNTRIPKLGLLLLALLFAAPPAPATHAQDAPDSARIRVAHASPDAPAVDILVDDAVAFSNAAFGAVTDYAELPPETYNIKVVPTGATEPVVIEADLTLESGTDYTVTAAGLLAEIEPLVLVDDNTLPEPGDAHVRFVHASPDAPAVDIAVADGGPVLFPDVSFKEVGDYLPVASNVYDLEVRIAGSGTVALSLPSVLLESQKVYTVFAMGLAAGEPALRAVTTVDAMFDGTPPSDGMADLRVAHASPDAPAVDVLVDDEVAFSNASFGAVTDYAKLEPGTYNVKVVPTGETMPVVIEAELTLEADMDYTVAAVGMLAEIEPLVLMDDNTLPAPADARVRFVHASPDAPAVDIAVANGGSVLFSNVAFKEVGDYLTIGNYLYDLEVRLAGTDTVVLSLPDVLLASQTVYTIFAMGLAGGDPDLRAVTMVDAMADTEPPAEGTARVRVAHAAPGAPNVDVLVDGSLAIANTAFGEVTDYAELPAGTYNVEIVPTGTSGPAVIQIELPLEAGKDYTAAAVGQGGAAGIIEPLLLEDDNSQPEAGKAHVRFVHASPDAPAVDIAVADGGPALFSDIAYKEIGDYLPVDAGTYDLEVRVAGTETVALSLPDVMLEAGTVYTVFAMGLAAGEPALQAVPSIDARYPDTTPPMPTTIRIFLPWLANTF